MGFVDELRWRNMLHDIMPGTEELLNKEMVTGYIGFDPTADSLGIGNMVQVMTLMHLQRAGHKPIALIGGATGRVGDPSGKTAERSLLSIEQIEYNLNCQKKQLEKFLDFDCGPNSAEIVNNYDWFKELTFLDFIRDAGKHITINYMLAKDSVKNRIEAESGMSFTEFTYQLIQGYDFYWLWKNKGIKLQLGGSDQWGNIVTGTELIRRKDAGEAFALTTQLIKKADGTKFGKSEAGNIWLDAGRTSVYKFYQFWLNVDDADLPKLLRIFSLKNKEEIEALEAQHAGSPNAMKKMLAEEITERVHSAAELKRAQETTAILFGSSFEDFKSLSETEIEDAFGEDITFNVGKEFFEAEVDAVGLLGEKTTIFKSKGDARKLIQGNGVSINKQKWSLDKKLSSADLLYGKYLLVQRGKKDYYLIVVN